MLVVEDDFLIATELAATLSDAGAEVIGPCYTVASALALAEDETLSAAVLDMHIGRDVVTPVARKLAALGTPFVFYTGQPDRDPLRSEWSDCQFISKPALPQALVAKVAALLKQSNDTACSASAA